MKIVKIILITLLSLVVLVILAWCVTTYLLWPKPELLGLVPETPLAYIAASNLPLTLLDARESEFSDRLARSPIWKTSLSKYWRGMKRQRSNWEEQMQASIDPKGIAKLVRRDAILAFYGDQRRLDFLLISEVSTLTRMNIKSGTTEKTLKEVYKFTKEKYRGAELITLAVPELKLSYGFIGRAGFLSTDISLVKKCVDLHKGIGQGMAAAPEYRKLTADLPESNISLHVNATKIRDANRHPIVSSLITRAKTDPLFRYLGPVAPHIDACVFTGSHQNGNLMFDVRVLYNPSTRSGGSDISTHHPTGLSDLTSHELPVPADCLLFGLYEMLEQSVLFEIVDTVVDIDLNAASDRLLPVLQSGAAIVVLKPNLEELQVLPPVMVFLQVKDKPAAQNALEDLSRSMKARGRQLEFNETKHANATIKHAKVPIGMGLSLDAGYTFVGDDLLIMASDISALKAAVDVSLDKQPSLMKDESYTSVLNPIAEGAEGRIFVDIVSTAEIIRQAGKLYAWRAKFAGEREGEQIATTLYQNVFILEAWRYVGITFEPEDDMTSVKMVLSSQ